MDSLGTAPGFTGTAGAAPLGLMALIGTTGTGLMGTIPGVPGTVGAAPLGSTALIGATGTGLMGTTPGFLGALGATTLGSTALIGTTGTGLLGTTPGFSGKIGVATLGANALNGTTGVSSPGFTGNMGVATLGANILLGTTSTGMMYTGPEFPGTLRASLIGALEGKGATGTAFIAKTGLWGIMGAATIEARTDPGLKGTEDAVTSSFKIMASFLDVSCALKSRCLLDIGRAGRAAATCSLVFPSRSR